MKKQEFIELLKNAKKDKKGNLYYKDKEYCNKRVYFATVNTICDDFVKEYCCDANGECYYYNRHFTNNDDTIEIQIVKGEHKKPKTNFDKITESVESLAEFIEKLDTFEFIGYSLKKQKFIEWLQKECEDD